ncbi:MAG: RluA family pseudouridine synthase [Saprospiraceae bacterium]|nr:RluA family pseudouridine synthase [Saprospiraceae bacterium]
MRARVHILYENNDLVIVDKPAGMLSIPDRYDPEIPNVLATLRQQYEEVWTVHRLDRETSGTICYALNAEAHKHLSGQFSERQPEKVYLALVENSPPEEEGLIDQPLTRHPGKPGRMIVSRKGKEARTRYRLLERFRQYSLLEIHLETGRTHQIRVHLASVGCPLAVDSFYGNREALYLSEFKKRNFRLGRGKEERPLMSRASLHAHSLGLTKPSGGEWLEVTAPLPKDFRASLQQLRKWAQA